MSDIRFKLFEKYQENLRKLQNYWLVFSPPFEMKNLSVLAKKP